MVIVSFHNLAPFDHGGTAADVDAYADLHCWRRAWHWWKRRGRTTHHRARTPPRSAHHDSTVT